MKPIKVKTGDKTVYLLGTGHILKESVDSVKEAMESIQPDAVALELDMGRLLALEQPKRKEPKFSDVLKAKGKRTFLAFYLLYTVQQHLGSLTNVKPGKEMATALKAARAQNVPAVLIDRDVRITLQRCLKQASWGEKLKLLTGALEGMFGTKESDILDIMENRQALMSELKRELPSFYRVLVTERDTYMANAIKSLPYQQVLVIVGAGHVEGIKSKLT